MQLESLFQQLIQYTVKIKLSKCSFCKASIKFLGHVISSGGIITVSR